MTTLHPTKTRLALLQAVGDGEVLVDYYGQVRDAITGATLTSRWRAVALAGWVQRPKGPEPRWKPAELTAAGWAVLEAGRGGGG